MDTGLNSLKTTSKKVVVHKRAEATGEFIGNKIADKIVKQKPVIDENSRNVKEIIIPSEKKGRHIKWFKANIKKMEYYKMSKLWNDSTVSQFVKNNVSK